MPDEVNNTHSTTATPFPFFPDNEEYWFETRRALGAASYWASDQAGFVMGERTPHATIAKFLKFNLRDGIAELISCPTLLDAEEDLYLKGQPDVLFQHLTCPKTMIRFTSAEGAGAHCQCGADRLANARIYDWLDDTFALTLNGKEQLCRMRLPSA